LCSSVLIATPRGASQRYARRGSLRQHIRACVIRYRPRF
jgi:hypothetical protein